MKLLVVVDMQNDFIDGALGTKEAIAILPNVVEKVNSFEGEVVFTMDTHTKEYLSTQEGRNLPVEHCIKGTKGWQLPDVLQNYAEMHSSKIYEKPAFGATELMAYVEELARKEELEEVVLIGVCTDICVISNAMLIKAAVPEVPVTVAASCCAGVTPESHRRALEAMKVCQVTICE